MNKFLTREFPKTKIVCTLGPASDSEEQLVELVKAGMSVARLNMSHGDLDTHIKVLNRVRKVSLELEIPVGVMVDVPGAKYRTGPLAPGAVQLQDGDEIVLTSQDLIGSSEKVSVAPPGIHLDAVAGTKILVDDGNIELRAIEVKDLDVMC